MSENAKFFAEHFRGVNEGQLLIIGSKGNSVLKAFDFPINPSEVAAFGTKHPDSHFKLNAFDFTKVIERNPYGTGGLAEVLQVVCFGVDVDANKGDHYPSHDQVMEVLKSLALPPSAILGSDGVSRGIHGHWWLENPISVTAENRGQLSSISERLQELIRSKLQAIDPKFKLDSTPGIERVLRCPGSLRKSGRRVTVLEMPSHRYTLDKIEAVIPPPPPPPKPIERTTAPGDSNIGRYLDQQGIEIADLLTKANYSPIVIERFKRGHL